MDLSDLISEIEKVKTAQTKTQQVERLSVPVEDQGYIKVRRILLTELEVKFWMTGEFPSEQNLIELFNTQDDRVTALKFLRDPDLKIQLTNRGLPEFTDRSARGFSPEAVLAANMITDIYDKRSIGAKLKALDLNTRQWQGFLKDKDFKQYYEKLVQDRFSSDTSTVAKINLGKLVENADLNAIKYFHELTGEYRPHSEEAQTLTLIIARMMEVLARFVTPEILSNIADELDTVIETRELTQ